MKSDTKREAEGMAGMPMRFARTVLVAHLSWAVLAVPACTLNTELECRSPADCTDPARPTCEQVPDEPCQVGASATNTRCAPASSCRCRVGFDPETYTTVPGRIMGLSCADPRPDSGYHGPPSECWESKHCSGQNIACIQPESTSCSYGEAPNGANCQSLDTPGCYCFVGDRPDAGGPYNPGLIVGEYCVGDADPDAGAPAD